MQKYKYSLNRKSLEIRYKSFIRPCLEYGDVIWSNTYNSEIEKLNKIQNTAMRCVTGATARTSTPNLYTKLPFFNYAI